MLVVLREPEGSVIAHQATLWERVLARVTAGRLDHELAHGDSPDDCPLRAIRARRLVRPAARRELAADVAAILAEAMGPAPTNRGLPVPPARDSVRGAVDMMRVLVDRLMVPGPVSACGIARVRLLLTDGSGPLYYAPSTQQLRAALEAALEALESVDDW